MEQLFFNIFNQSNRSAHLLFLFLSLELLLLLIYFYTDGKKKFLMQHYLLIHVYQSFDYQIISF